MPSEILKLFTKTIRSLYKDQCEVLNYSHRMESWKCLLTLVSHNLGIKESDSIKTIFVSKKCHSDYTFIGGSLKHGKLNFGLMHSFCFGFDDKRKLKNLISSSFALSLNALV